MWCKDAYIINKPGNFTNNTKLKTTGIFTICFLARVSLEEYTE